LIASLEGQDPRLDGGNYKRRTDAIEKCASVAKQRGYSVFALQDGGRCLSSPTALMTFSTYGSSSWCNSDGRGGRSANHVYAVGGIKGTTTLLFFIYKRNETYKTMKERKPRKEQRQSSFKTVGYQEVAELT